MPLNEWEKLPKTVLLKSRNRITQLMLQLASSGGRVKIRYFSAGKLTERWIRPARAFTVNSVKWPSEYIEAFCELRGEARVFDVAHVTLLDSIPLDMPATYISSGEVSCSVEFVDLPGDDREVPGVEAKCNRCGHTTESFGTGPNSITRCLVLMREECPLNESNFYVAE